VDDLNYHHLRYFWAAATDGSITAASRRLRVSHPTISTQIHQLEATLGTELLERQGRGLVLTESGRLALRYADEIFALGRELVDTVRGRAQPTELRLRVGVIDLLPKSIVHRLLAPAFALGRGLRLTVHENRSLTQFVGELATHELDLVLSDGPAGAGLPVKLYDQLLGQSETVLVAAPSLAASLHDGFPASLDGAPALLPTPATTLRRSLDAWFDQHGVRPVVVAEVDDSSLVKVLAESGVGFCAIPRAVQAEAERRYGLVAIGITAVMHQVWAISAERRVAHPAVLAIREAARGYLGPADGPSDP
jgi:LysR family transcriptional regulator, transcriptional activator of nhaA